MVKLMFGKCSLAIFIRALGLQVATPIGLGTKKAEHFLPQFLSGFNPKIVAMSPTVCCCENSERKRWYGNSTMCVAVAEHQILGGKHFLILIETRVKKDWLAEKGATPSEKYHCQ